MVSKPTVLLYNFTDKRRRNKINAFCAMQGIRVKAVEKEQYGKPLITLIGKEAEQGAQQEALDFSDEMLVMCGLGGKMNMLLSYLRREKVIVPLKAVLTPVNQFWDSAQLYQEIRKEHEQMTGQE